MLLSPRNRTSLAPRLAPSLYDTESASQTLRFCDTTASTASAQLASLRGVVLAFLAAVVRTVVFLALFPALLAALLFDAGLRLGVGRAARAAGRCAG